MQRDFRFHPRRLAGGLPLPAFLLGLAFGFGWTPCIGSILGAIFTLSATQTSVSGGVGLLAGLVLIAMGVAMMTGQLSRFAFWLLQAFPAFARIG